MTAAVGTPRWGRWLTAAVAASWLAYWPMLGSWFRHDDWGWLARAGAWSSNLAELPWGHTGVTPLFNLVILVGWQLGGMTSTAPYFAILISAHGLTSWLVARLAWRLTGHGLAAALAGLFFCWCWCHHETVGWIAGGYRVFVGAGALIGVLGWLDRDQLGPAASRSCRLAAWTTPWWKETGVVLVLLGWLTARLDRDQTQRWEPRRLLGWFGPALLAYLVWRLACPPRVETIPAASGIYRLGWHWLTNLLVCPAQVLLPDLRYGNYQALLARCLPAGVVVAAGWAAVLGQIALTAGAVLAWRRGGGAVRFAVGWTVVAFLPFLPFIPEFARAPRYLYLPSMGVAWLVALAVTRWAAQRRRWPLALVAVWLLLNLGSIWLMAGSRHRDSQARRELVASALRSLPPTDRPRTVRLADLPERFTDLTEALPLWTGPGTTFELARPGAVGAVTLRYQPGLPASFAPDR